MTRLQSILFLILWVPGLTLAQVQHLGRYELEHNWDNIDYVVISQEENGVLIVQPQLKGNNKQYPVVFHHLDKQLNFLWADSLTVDRQLHLKGYHYVGDKTLLLFQNTQLNRLIKLVSVDLKQRELQEFEPKTIVDLDIQEFEVIQDHAVIGGYIESRPAVFAYDLNTNKVKTLPNVFQNNSELLEVKVNADSVTFNVLSSKQNLQKDRTIVVNTYDYNGNAIRGYELETAKDHQLLSAVSSSIIDKEQLVVGLYSVKTGTFPSGFYVNHVDRTGRQTMRYYNFGEFNSFLDHNGERRAEKLKDKAITAKKRGREWRYKIDGLFTEMEESREALIIMGEFFKPWNMSTQNYMRYRQVTSPLIAPTDPFYNPYDAWTRSNFRSASQPNEFDFTHAFAFAINHKGELLWDHSMDIDEELKGTLRTFGAFQWSGADAYYAYYLDEELVARHLNGNEKERMVQKLRLMDDEDQLRYEKEEFQGIVGWFGNRFLVYGVQNVKNPEGDGNRKVFFVNAVAIEH